MQVFMIDKFNFYCIKTIRLLFVFALLILTKETEYRSTNRNEYEFFFVEFATELIN